MSRAAPRWHGWALFGVALLLGLGWRAVAGPRLVIRDGVYDDGRFIDAAEAMLAGRMPAPALAPGYPVFLTPFVALGEGGLRLALWAQLLLTAALAPALWRLALAQGLPPGAALCAGALAAANPTLILMSYRYMTEPLFAALLLAFLASWGRAWSGGGLRAAALAGVCGGFASLTRGVILAFGGTLALAAWLLRRRQPRWAGLVAVCGLCWAAMLAPWTALNWAKYHRFMPVSLQGGWNFYEGLAETPAELEMRARLMGRETQALGLSDAFMINDYFRAKGRAWVREHPAGFARLLALKAVAFWRLAPNAPHPRWARAVAGAYSIALFSLALYGFVQGPSLPLTPFLLAWIFHLNLMHSIFASNLRYRMPAELALALLAGAGFALVVRRGAR